MELTEAKAILGEQRKFMLLQVAELRRQADEMEKLATALGVV